MNARVVERILWGGAVALAIGAVVGWRGDTPSAAAQPTASLAEPEPLYRISSDSLTASAAAVAERNPFRADRRPTHVAYTPELESASPAPPSPRVNPPLVLRGIIGGPPWEAVLEGVPGRASNVVVRSGDVLGDSIAPLRIHAVGRDTVVVRGADTTWRLTMTRTW